MGCVNLVNKEKLKANIKYFREECVGLTLEELAGKINVTRQTISKWEKGTALPSLDDIDCMCKVFGCDPDRLLGEFDDCKTRDNQFIHNQTGLHEDAIEALNRLLTVDLVDDPERARQLREACFAFVENIITYKGLSTLAVLNENLVLETSLRFFIADENGKVADALGDDAWYMLFIRAINDFISHEKNIAISYKKLLQE